jgi:hypothetical protein
MALRDDKDPGEVVKGGVMIAAIALVIQLFAEALHSHQHSQLDKLRVV